VGRFEGGYWADYQPTGFDDSLSSSLYGLMPHSNGAGQEAMTPSISVFPQGNSVFGVHNVRPSYPIYDKSRDEMIGGHNGKR